MEAQEKLCPAYKKTSVHDKLAQINIIGKRKACF